MEATEKKSSEEQKRINSIKENGGRHLQNFKEKNITYDMCLTAVELDGEALKYVPKQYLTKEIYEAACKRTGMMLSKVPEKFVSKKICEYAVTSDGLALDFVPEKYKSAEVCLKAVINNALAFQRMPEELITVEFVVKVIKKNRSGIEAISSLPKKFKTTKFYMPLVEACPDVIWNLPKSAHTVAICNAAIKAMKYSGAADAIKVNPELLSQLHTSLYDHDACLAFVTSDFFKDTIDKKDYIGTYCGFNTRDDEENGLFFMNRQYYSPYSLFHMMKWEDVCKELLAVRPSFIKYVKPECITRELCEVAIKNAWHGDVLKYIPDIFKTKELCNLAFERSPYSIEYIPEEYITERQCLQAIKCSGYLLNDIPMKYRTKEICMIAMQSDSSPDFKDIPKEFLDKDIYLSWLMNSSFKIDPLKKIPEQFYDYDIYLAAVKADGRELKYVPKELISSEMCYEAIRKDSEAAKYIPPNLFSEKMANALVEKGDYYFEYIPKEVLNEEICIKAIKKGDRFRGTVLKHIPDEMKTQKMCDVAIEVSVWSLASVPEKYVTLDMLIYVAKQAPGRLEDNFPQKYRTQEFIKKIVEQAPGAEGYIKNNIMK